VVVVVVVPVVAVLVGGATAAGKLHVYFTSMNMARCDRG